MPISPEQKPEYHSLDSEKTSNPEGEKTEWVTVKEAVEISGYREDTIRRLIDRGHIPAERREREYQFTVRRKLIHVPLSELMRYKEGPKDKGGRPRKKAR